LPGPASGGLSDVPGRGEFVRLAFEEAGKREIAQTANIPFFPGGRHGLAPKNDAGRFHTRQLPLTLADFVAIEGTLPCVRSAGKE